MYGYWRDPYRITRTWELRHLQWVEVVDLDPCTGRVTIWPVQVVGLPRRTYLGYLVSVMSAWRIHELELPRLGIYAASRRTPGVWYHGHGTHRKVRRRPEFPYIRYGHKPW